MSDAGARRPGRPRDPQADEAILLAAREVMAESGFGGFTVDAVATRASVGKATIYRRWPSREALAMDVARCIVEPEQDPDTGSLRTDLIELFTTAYLTKVRALRDPDAGEPLAAIIAESGVNPELKGLVHEFVEQRRSLTRTIFDRAVARGELATDVDRDLVIDLLAGPLLYRTLMSGRTVDRAVVTSIVDIVLTGLGVVGATQSGGVVRGNATR